MFSMDHKIISKQFLFTAMFMAFAAAIMSTLFRLQLAWPGPCNFRCMHYFLGDRWAKGGILDPNMYLGFSYHSRYHYGVLPFNRRIKRNICQSSYSTSGRCARYGISYAEYAFLLVFLISSIIMLFHYMLKRDRHRQDGPYILRLVHCPRQYRVRVRV